MLAANCSAVSFGSRKVAPVCTEERCRWRAPQSIYANLSRSGISEAHIDGTDLGQAMQQIAKVRPMEAFSRGLSSFTVPVPNGHSALEHDRTRFARRAEGHVRGRYSGALCRIFARQLTAAGLQTAAHAPQGGSRSSATCAPTSRSRMGGSA